MDNQEAIERIRDDMKKNHDYPSSEYRKALRMAISALEGQDVSDTSDTNVGDMVSRKAANRLTTLISDINPTEICKQIELNNLSFWCETMKNEMRRAMVQFVCGAGED